MPDVPVLPAELVDRATEDLHDMARWTNGVALVTGASEGIGAAVATRLVTEGLQVVGCARRVERLDALRSQLGARFVPVACDLRDPAAIAAMFAEIDDRFGRLDVLVNNAGLGHKAPLLTGDSDHWREMLEVNVLALCICTREAVARMRERGHVIHISSLSAHRVPPGSGVYSATKHAVKALTEALRLELYDSERPVRVTSISPGFVETGFAAHYHKSQEAADHTYSQYPVLQPRDVADAVVYALSAPPRAQVHDLLLRPTRQPR